VPKFRRLEPFVIALIVIIHLCALVVFGATYWIDSIAYASLSVSFEQQNGFQEFYGSVGRWVYSHLGPGVPSLWFILNKLPTEWQWPILAVLQHSLAAIALVFTFKTVNRFWPSPWHLVFLLLILLLPTYQAFHNALLTESATSSLLLIAFSCCIHVAKGERHISSYILIGSSALFLLTQFRSYWGAAVALMLFISIAYRGLLWTRWPFVLGIIAVSSALLFPGYRYLQTGQFFLPGGGINSLISASHANPQPSDKVKAVFSAADLPREIDIDRLLSDGISMTDALSIASHWRSAGLSNKEIEDQSAYLAGLLKNEQAGVQLNRWVYGMASIGMMSPLLILPKDHRVFLDYSPEKLLAHIYHYQLWHSWISADNYNRIFDVFFGSEGRDSADVFPFGAAGAETIDLAFKPYLSPLPTQIRDPLLLGRIPLDLWTLMGFLGAVYLALRAGFISVLFLCAVVPAFFVAFLFPLGNTRYSVPLLPLYLFLASIAVSYMHPPRMVKSWIDAARSTKIGMKLKIF
jgi:hypothetical protein